MGRSGHIAEVRAAYGPGLLLMPAVCAAVLDGDRLLLVRHRRDGKWGTPGGAMEPGETPAEGVRRELREETGLELVPEALIAVTGGPGFVVTYPNGDRTAYVTTIFALPWDGSPVEPDGVEVDAFRWVGAEDLADVSIDELTRRNLATVFAWLASPDDGALVHPPS